MRGEKRLGDYIVRLVSCLRIDVRVSEKDILQFTRNQELISTQSKKIFLIPRWFLLKRCIRGTMRTLLRTKSIIVIVDIYTDRNKGNGAMGVELFESHWSICS